MDIIIKGLAIFRQALYDIKECFFGFYKIQEI